MLARRVKSLLVAGFSVFIVSFFNPALAQEDSAHKEAKNSFNAKEIIFGHVLNNHDFHIIDIVHDDGSKHPVSIPLPVILYSPQKGFDVFMSSKFHHGEETYKGYELLTNEKITEENLDPKKYTAGQIVAVNNVGEIDNTIKVYDISLTRNVVQMLLSLALLVWLLVYMAKKYRTGQGIETAPKGVQNLIEPIITFISSSLALLIILLAGVIPLHFVSFMLIP